jgi:hypothetical protein
VTTSGRPASAGRPRSLLENTPGLKARRRKGNLSAMADPKRSGATRTAPERGEIIILLLAFVGIALSAGGSHLPEPTRAPNQHAARSVQVPPDFTHADHESVQCFTCHDTGDQHGALLINTIQDCRGCHHTTPLAAACSRCHAAADAPGDSLRVVRPVSFSMGTRDPARALTFLHEPHRTIECARCHTEGTTLAVAADLDCAGCHEDHHTPLSDCASCHVAAPVSAHPPAEAHVTCSGAACHQRLPFESVPRTRELCLGCHQGMREHEAPRACAECHSLPAPRPQAGGVE